jgi:hypothetical protein
MTLNAENACVFVSLRRCVITVAAAAILTQLRCIVMAQHHSAAFDKSHCNHKGDYTAQRLGARPPLVSGEIAHQSL